MDTSHGASNGANPDTTSISTIVVKSGVLQLVVAILQVSKTLYGFFVDFFFFSVFCVIKIVKNEKVLKVVEKSVLSLKR